MMSLLFFSSGNTNTTVTPAANYTTETVGKDENPSACPLLGHIGAIQSMDLQSPPLPQGVVYSPAWVSVLVGV